MVENDAVYFERRAAEELCAANCATSPEAERAHRDLCRLYARMIEQSVVTPIRPLDAAQA